MGKGYYVVSEPVLNVMFSAVLIWFFVICEERKMWAL